MVAGIAWAAPDQFAPVQGDSSSWENPKDRFDTQESGATWTPIACSVAAVFLASTIYGQVVSPEGASSDADWGGAAAAFVNGFQQAGQPPSGNGQALPGAYETREPCTSDFSCGTGQRCVKRMYTSSGFCARSVDAAGAPTGDPPDLNSVGPNFGETSDCEADGCPAGFRCDAPSGVCLR